MKVTATANGYYGGKYRVPGEVFNLSQPDHFADAWMDKGDDEGVKTRKVNVGGTDGVESVSIPAPGAKLSAKERIALANQISGRTDVRTAAEADTIIAAVEATSGGTDRSRDMSVDQSANLSADQVDALDHDANGKKGGAKKPADDGDI